MKTIKSLLSWMYMKCIAYERRQRQRRRLEDLIDDTYLDRATRNKRS